MEYVYIVLHLFDYRASQQDVYLRVEERKIEAVLDTLRRFLEINY